MKNRKADLLYRLGEALAAGMYEAENATVVERYGRGLRRYFEHAVPPLAAGPLYPPPECHLWQLAGPCVRFQYSGTLETDFARLRETGAARLTDPFERNLLEKIIEELGYFQTNLIPPRYGIGGAGYTHSVLNYRRILREGLGAYRKRVAAMVASPLRRALADTLAGITDFARRAPGDLAAVIEAPAHDFKSAMRSFSFFYALDGYDSAGRFAEYLGEYYRGEPDAEAWIAELYRMVDRQGGWHFLHSGRYPEFTRLCLRAQTLRRPNSGLLVGPDTPEEIWDEVFDLWSKGIPSPALYSEAGYRRGLRAYPEIARADRDHFVFGGCTELMFEGCSSIGSIEAGINLLEIWNHSTPTRFAAELRLRLEELAAGVKANSEFAARNRPQLIRTLFIDDCIERNLEYRAGGARCNGGVVNVAGLTDTANAIAAARGIKAKFGNDNPDVDAIARRLAETVFRQIRRHPMRNGGPAFPAVIMFVTYPYHGSYVDASADGRPAGAPLADSAGAATGTDRHGPTALLNSVTKLPSQLGIGTLVLNLRIERELAADPAKRRKLQALLQGFFARGGLQLQVTLIDRETMQKAYEEPDHYPELIVRIGGYSEYYQRLSRELQLAVLERTEHLL